MIDNSEVMEKRRNTSDWLKAVDLPEAMAKHVDLDYLYEEINITRAEAVELNTVVLGFLLSQVNGVDDILLADYRDQFGAWDLVIFDRLEATIRSKLRSHLREHGIYTGPPNGRLSTQLVDALGLQEIPDWPGEELIKAKRFHPDSIVTDWRQRVIEGKPMKITAAKATPTTTTPSDDQLPQSPPVKPTATPQMSPPPEPANRHLQDSPLTQFPTLYRFQQPQIYQTATAPSPQNGPNRTVPTAFITPLQADDSIENEAAYTILPPIEFPSTALEATSVATFGRIWDKQLAYTGDSYDIFDDKVRFLLNTAMMAQIKPSQVWAVFSMMLIGRARDWFINNVAPRSTFAQMYCRIKTHFDIEVNHHKYYTDWTSITFGSITADPVMYGKTKLEILQALLDKLQLCQRALGESFRGDIQLKINTERACKGVPDFKMALFEPAPTFEALSSKLRSALQVEADEASAQYYQTYGHFYTDHHYIVTPRDDSRGHQKGKTKWRKKCWICSKIGCFSTNHPQTDRDEAYKRYKNIQRFQSEKKSPGRGYVAFRLDYEGEPEESDDDGSDDDASDDKDGHG